MCAPGIRQGHDQLGYRGLCAGRFLVERPVVGHVVVPRRWLVGEPGGLYLAVHLVEQVRDGLEVPAARAHLTDQLSNWLEGVVTLDDDVDARVADQLAGIIRRRDSAKDGQRVRMFLLQEGGEL